MEVTEKQFYISYITGILIAILLCSAVSAYYSYHNSKKIDDMTATLEGWELTK